MSLPYLGGAGENLSGLGELAGVIGQILKPNAQFEQMTKLAFLQKPELMQKFVDVEKANPGTLKAFGFGDGASDLLSGMQESIPSLVERSIHPEIEQILHEDGSLRQTKARETVTGKTAADEAGEDMSKWMSTTFLKVFKEDQGLAMRLLRAKTGIGSALENQTEDMTRENINNIPEELKKRNPKDVIADFVSGKVSPMEFTGVLQDPTMGAAYGFAMKDYAENREIALRQELGRMSVDARSNSTEDIMHRAKVAAAFDAWQAAKGKGSVQGWYKQLWQDEGAGPVKPTDEKDIAEAMKDQQLSAFLTNTIKLRQGIEPLITQIKKGGTTEEQNLRTDQINTILTEAGIPWRAEWNTSRGMLGPMAPNKLLFRNGDQVTEDPTAVFSRIPPTSTQTAPPPTLSPVEQAQAGYLSSLTGADRAARIAEIRKRVTPDRAAAIIQAAGGENK